jgi:hypothetical protein
MLLIGAVALAATLPAGCGNAYVPPPTAIVPQNANMIVYLDSRQLDEGGPFAEFMSAMGDDEYEDMRADLDEWEADLGGRVEGLFGFGELAWDAPDPFDDAGYRVAAMVGDFDRDRAASFVEDEGATDIEHRGYRVYVDWTGTEGNVLLGNNMVVGGSLDAVKDAIDVRKGHRRRAEGDLIAMYEGLDDGWMKMVMAFSDEDRQQIRQGLAGETAELMTPDVIPALEALAEIETIGMSFGGDAESIAIQFRMGFTGPEAAEAMEGLVNMFLMVVSLAPETPDFPAELKQVLKDIDVSMTGSVVDVTLGMSLDDFRSLIEAIEESAEYDLEVPDYDIKDFPI